MTSSTLRFDLGGCDGPTSWKTDTVNAPGGSNLPFWSNGGISSMMTPQGPLV
jgi:hypothetical protein